VRSLLAIGAAVFAVACAAFAAARAEPQPAYPRDAALAAAKRAAPAGWSDVRVLPLDRTHWRVTFFDGPRELLDLAIGPAGRVDATEVHEPGIHPPGSATLWSPALLLLFSALFVAAVAVRPLWSLRNLDALMIGTGFTISALLIDDRLVAAHVYAGAAVLAYIAVRCGVGAFAPTEPEPSEPLLQLERWLPWITGATLVAGVVLVVTSAGLSDVAFAGMAGGTLMNHGTSPYGHIPAEVVHGDTYPVLTYVLYMPFAAIAPVRDSFDSLDGALWLNAIALLAAALFTRAWGMRTTLAWLAFPPVLLAASGGGNDVPAAAFTIAGLAYAARSELSAGLLTLAGWVKIAPAVALIPLLARLRGAALGRAVTLVLALLAAGVVTMLAFGGTDAIEKATSAVRFQSERGSWFSVWRQLGAPALQVALQALTVAFAAVGAVAVWRGRMASLRQTAALTGGVIALIQLSANYWTYAYLPWLLPFILVALFPPAHPRSRQPEPRAP
jgi:hypothetical protein